MGTPKGPLPWPFTSPGEAGTPPTPTPSLGHSSHSTSVRRKKLGTGMSLPLGAEHPGAALGQEWRGSGLPFINIIHQTSSVVYP